MGHTAKLPPHAAPQNRVRQGARPSAQLGQLDGFWTGPFRLLLVPTLRRQPLPTSAPSEQPSFFYTSQPPLPRCPLGWGGNQ